MENEKIEVFELEDDFDPLEDAGLQLDGDEEYAGGIEYQVPVIPDADKSIVPEPVILPPEERIEKLITGIPGQKFRILTGIRICKEPKTLEEASTELEAEYPQGTSVYTAARIIELLTDAGALDRIDPEPEPEEETEDADAEAESAVQAAAEAEDAEERVDAIEWDDSNLDFDEVEQVEPSTYVATDEGLAAIESHWSASLGIKVIQDEPQYLPIWKKVLEMCDRPEGCSRKEIADAVDSDPLVQEPRRWCQYFLEKLREASALTYTDAWIITDNGREVLASDLFTE